jgi:putative SOS response-associated peptidase YedK
MCGRFSLTRGDRDIEEEFGAKPPQGYRLRYNIAPTQEVLALIDEGGGRRRIEALRWGLIPSWAGGTKLGEGFINARAETIFERPSFRRVARSRRCLIIADGFYEWHKGPQGKTPFYIRLKSKRPFGFAGLWDEWISPEGHHIKTCAIVTTEANELLRPIHGRMPVIVPKELEALWLDPNVHEPQALAPVLRPYPAAEMEVYQVARWVNSPANDRPECIEPLRH